MGQLIFLGQKVLCTSPCRLSDGMSDSVMGCENLWRDAQGVNLVQRHGKEFSKPKSM